MSLILTEGEITEAEPETVCVVRRVTRTDSDRLLACLLATFPSPVGETMANALDIRRAEYRGYAAQVTEKAVADGLSVGAFHAGTGAMLGFCVCEDLTTTPRYAEREVHLKFLPILDLLDQLFETGMGGAPPPRGACLYVSLLGVSFGARGMGLAPRLLAGALDVAERNAFVTAVAAATGVASQATFRRAGFERRHGVRYRDYAYSGRRVFAAIEAPAECALVERRLGVAL